MADALTFTPVDGIGEVVADKHRRAPRERRVLHHPRHGLALRGRALGTCALVTAAVSLVGTIGLFAVTMLATWGGLFERVSLWPAYLWLGALGALAQRRRETRA